MSGKVNAAVAGANGYAGMTLVNLLMRHPDVELRQLASRSFAGKPFASVFPLLDLEGEFVPDPDPAGIDVVFSCLPHNVGAAKAGGWREGHRHERRLPAQGSEPVPEVVPAGSSGPGAAGEGGAWASRAART